MKSNTSPDMIAAFFADGGKVSTGKSRSHPPREACLRSGNHIPFRKNDDLRRQIHRPVPAMPPRSKKEVA